jgi:DedD protein
MDSRAKQRLTGAVILVAVFVLLVPELLTGPGAGKPSPEAPNEEGLRRYTIDLDAHSNSAQPMAPATNEPAVALPPVAENPMSAAPTLAAPRDDANPQAPPPAATPMAVEPAAVTPRPPPTARADLPRPAAPPERGSFAVQLGSFGSRANADRLVRDMTAKGFAAFVAPITSNGRELFRVRVGPTRDRASAEALAAQLRRIGQTGSIVPIS